MRTKHAALEFRMGRLAMPWKTSDPKTEGLPVDEGDDPEGDQRIPCGEPEQLAVGQGKTASGQSADQLDLPVRSHVIDPDLQPVIRSPEIEIKSQLQIAEWGDVKLLGDHAAEAFGGDRRCGLRGGHGNLERL
ncbi:MAG: hypothetical protein RIS76_3275 [Verrucomicrobiota bacterium]